MSRFSRMQGHWGRAAHLSSLQESMAAILYQFSARIFSGNLFIWVQMGLAKVDIYDGLIEWNLEHNQQRGGFAFAGSDGTKEKEEKAIES
ncbi:hypothetical protein Fmac_032661 [Flemingia macrophylla]|uniref:Uncharacterized protein n=1 Tax=Flemingia macrophylla TaxID=520843 RepID=A0ABD1L6Z4_9FABA